MGAETSKPSGAEGSPPTQSAAPPVAAAATGACPLGFDKASKGTATTPGQAAAASACPVNHTSADSKNAPGAVVASDGGGAGGTSSRSTGCPVKEEDRAGAAAKYLHPHKYNVYSQRVDSGGAAAAAGAATAAAGGGAKGDASFGNLNPSNNMPVSPNQMPAPGQQKPLSTERVQSTIPKGGDDATWSYPSPQMFWNALSRKGKADGTEEGDMHVVVSIHNNMNELTWKKVLQWEELRKARAGEVSRDGTEPRLLRFQGRPDDTTPKALMKMMLGHPLPFDRHDWVVDRGGDERRYVIDYYHDEGAGEKDEVPELHSEDAVKSIKVDVRPALDSLRDFGDRALKMPLARLTGRSEFTPLPLRPSPTMKAREPRALVRSKQGLPRAPSTTRSSPSREETSKGTSPSKMEQKESGGGRGGSGDGGQSARDARAIARMKKKCAKPFKALRAAEEADDAAIAEAAALKLEFCMARYVCRKEARAYKEAVTYVDALPVIGAAHARWAEAALEMRMVDMRAAHARFTERQLDARRREEGGGKEPPGV